MANTEMAVYLINVGTDPSMCVDDVTLKLREIGKKWIMCAFLDALFVEH